MTLQTRFESNSLLYVNLTDIWTKKLRISCGFYHLKKISQLLGIPDLLLKANYSLPRVRLSVFVFTWCNVRFTNCSQARLANEISYKDVTMQHAQTYHGNQQQQAEKDLIKSQVIFH